jgi:hypothetical protein
VAPDVDAADATLTPRFTDHLVAAGCADVPDEWLAGEPGFAGPEDVRRGYRNWFRARLAARPMWVPALRDSVAAGPRRLLNNPRGCDC